MTEIDRRTMLSAGLGGLAAAGTAVLGAGTASAQEAGEASARPLAGRVALVTGAARGIGRACAIGLAREGAAVALVDIADPDGVAALNDYPLASSEDLAEAQRLVEEQGVRALPIVADVRDLEALKAAAERTAAELGSLDILVANAGVNAAKDTLDTFSEEKFDAMMNVNVRGVANSVLAARPHLADTNRGRVVIISSIAGRRGSSGMIYSSSKWAVTGLMKSMAQELGEQGITVNCVAPSGTDTDMFFRGFTGTGSREEVEERTAAQSPLQGVGVLDPADIADAVVFLAGPGGSRISGATIDVNAGRSASNLG